MFYAQIPSKMLYTIYTMYHVPCTERECVREGDRERESEREKDRESLRRREEAESLCFIPDVPSQMLHTVRIWKRERMCLYAMYLPK